MLPRPLTSLGSRGVNLVLATLRRIDPAHREPLKDLAFGHFGFLFRGTATYRNWRSFTFPANQPTWKDPPYGGFDSLAFEVSPEPIVSVIIPVHNNVEYTQACLWSIQESRPLVPFEIIIVDDGCLDGTREQVPRIRGVRYIRNAQSVGLGGSCNLGASTAHGKYLIFLSNGTQVAPSWMDELVQTITHVADAGLVGSKLCFPEGRLLEAGAIIWKDGSTWHCGRGDDLGKPEYNYLREVDYCSRTSILVRADLFREVGGFDERYAQGHYGDADLAFKIRARGYRVFYQPMSQVTCANPLFSGTPDIEAGALRKANRSKFAATWAGELNARGGRSKNPHLTKERGSAHRVLLIDAHTPTPDHDAGSTITFEFARLFQRLSYKVTFIPDNFNYINRYTSDLQRIGVECIYRPFTSSVRTHVKRVGKLYDLVVVCRAAVAHKYLDDIREYCPNASIIFHTIDLCYLREERRAELEKSDIIRKLANELKAQELAAIRKCDCTIVVSKYEHELVTEQLPEAHVVIFPLILQSRGSVASFRERRDILFLGNFNHTPNTDAVLYFVSEIWPKVRAVMPRTRLYVVGGNPPGDIVDLCSDSIVVTGHVEELSGYLDRVRLSVAPLRYGAGIKGKIGTSLSYGLPCVASPIAVEGMGLTDGLDVLVGEDARDFVEDICRLYTDERLWTAVSDNGLAFVRKHYSFGAAVKRLSMILEAIPVGPKPMPLKRPAAAPAGLSSR